MIYRVFFIAKRPLEPPILKTIPIVIENTQTVASLKIFAKRSNRYRNSTLNIAIEDIPENVTVSAGIRFSDNLRRRERRELSALTLNENDLNDLSLNIQPSVGSFNLTIIARESTSNGEISIRKSEVQITRRPPVPNPGLFVAPICYVQNRTHVSLNVTLTESNAAGIIYSLNITIQDGFEVLDAMQFTPGIYTLSSPLPEMITLKSNTTIKAPFNVLVVAAAKRIVSNEVSVNKQRMTIDTCELAGILCKITITYNAPKSTHLFQNHIYISYLPCQSYLPSRTYMINLFCKNT